jgi:hypothetical protein
MILRHALPYLGLLLTPTAVVAQSLDWARTVGANLQEIAWAVAIDGQNSVVTAGTFTNTADLDPGPGVFNVTSGGDHDIFIQKLDSAGNFLWGGSIGVSGAEYPRSIAIDAQDNIYVTGRVRGTVDLNPGPGTDFQTTSNTGFDAFVIKLASSGAYQWGRLLGGLNNDEGQGIAIDSQGHVVTVGYIGAVSDLDPGPGTANAGGNGLQDAFVQKMDANGNFLWGFAIGGTANDIAYAVCVDAQDNIIVTGEFRSTIDLDPGPGTASRISGGDADIFVLKVSSSGAFLWGAAIGSTGNERGRAIGVGPDGGPVLTGRITSSTDFDPGPGVFNLAGDFTEPAFVCKLNGEGSLAWAFLLKSFINEGLALRVDGLNRVLVGVNFGTFTGSPLDIDPGPGVVPLSSNGGGDILIASYTAAGALLWGMQVGGSSTEIVNGVANGTQSRFVVCGQYSGTLDVDPGPGVQLVTAAGSSDAITIQYRKPDCAGIFIRPKAILEGPYAPEGFSLMSDQLRAAGLVPLQEPYSAMGYTLEQPASTTAGALAFQLANSVVDWVLVELRSTADPALVVARRAALVQRDGDIVAPDNASPVGFCAGEGQYHIAVRHRNHLGVMTGAPVALSATPVTIDFTSPSTTVFGSEPMKPLDALRGLWAGNVDPDAVIRYIGQGNDRDPILLRIGGSTPTATAAGYWPEDVNLDGLVKYMGQDNDRDPILVNIGGSTPTATRQQQLP